MSQSISIIEQRVTAGNNFDGASGASTGSITTVAGSALVAGEAFFLNDGKSAEVEFRFLEDTAFRFVPSPTLRPVVFTSGDSANQIRDKLIIAINNTRSLNILAGDGGAATVDLTHRVGGTVGNRAPTADTVVDGTFAVTAMAGGANRAFQDIDGTRIYDAAADGGQFDFPFSIPQSIPQGEPARGGVLTWIVERIVLTGDATGHVVNLLLPDGTVIELASGAGTDVIEGPFTLAGGERLQITTAGASAALFLSVFARPQLPLPSSAF